MNEGMTLFFLQKHVFIFLERGRISLVYKRETETNVDWGRWIQTATLIHSFSSWSYHAVLSSRPFVFSSLTRSSQLGATCWPQRLKTADWQLTAACILYGHRHISFHNAHTFLFNQLTVSAYLHRCVLWRESPIDDSVKGQYTTIRSRVNIQHSGVM